MSETLVLIKREGRLRLKGGIESEGGKTALFTFHREMQRNFKAGRTRTQPITELDGMERWRER